MSSYRLADEGIELDEPDEEVEITRTVRPGDVAYEAIEDEVVEYIPGPPILVKPAHGDWEAEYEDGGEIINHRSVTFYWQEIIVDVERGCAVIRYGEHEPEDGIVFTIKRAVMSHAQS
jgi:hypothetical protein